MSSRTGKIERETKETSISVVIDLDEPGRIEVDTSLPFLGHMLDSFACHGEFSLRVRAEGDIDVDPHHLVEDCGIVLGGAVGKALGGFGGVARSGHCIFPMDGSLALAAIDICGRPNLFRRGGLSASPLGGVNPALFWEFFKGFADALRCTLHIELMRIDNDHHAVEAAFKAFGRALRQAVVPTESGTFSTKGVIDG